MNGSALLDMYLVKAINSLEHIDTADGYEAAVGLKRVRRALKARIENQAAAVPGEPTAEMIRNAQLHSEIGTYVTANWANAYDCLVELYKTMLATAPPTSVERKVG